MNNETIILTDHDYNDVVKQMKKIAKDGMNNPVIKQISDNARLIWNADQREKFILNSVYDLAVFEASPNDRQQLRTIDNIIRTKKANCTGYSTLLSAVLLNLNTPHYFKLIDTMGLGFDHVYIITNNNILDAVLSQKQDNTDTFENRPKKPIFNDEANYYDYKIYPMLSVINGAQNRVKNARRQTQINGYLEEALGGLAAIIGDECKRECDIKYFNDYAMREWCKADCNEKRVNQYGSTYRPPDIQATDNTILWVAGIFGAILLLKNK